MPTPPDPLRTLAGRYDPAVFDARAGAARRRDHEWALAEFFGVVP